jgi:hypothetical protein
MDIGSPKRHPYAFTEKLSHHFIILLPLSEGWAPLNPFSKQLGYFYHLASVISIQNDELND